MNQDFKNMTKKLYMENESLHFITSHLFENELNYKNCDTSKSPIQSYEEIFNEVFDYCKNNQYEWLDEEDDRLTHLRRDK